VLAEQVAAEAAADTLDGAAGGKLGGPQVSCHQVVDQAARIPVGAGCGGMPAVCGNTIDDAAGGVKRPRVKLRDTGQARAFLR
jgi:hypothetical protein